MSRWFEDLFVSNDLFMSIGDSGGPLWRWESVCISVESFIHFLLSSQNDKGKNKAVQLGLISRGQKCARINRPGIYTKLSAFKDWIMNNTLDGGCTSFV